MTFIKLHTAVSKSTELSAIEKILYCYLDGWRQNTKRIYPSYDYLAEQLGVNAQTIKRTLASLEKKGLILRKGKGALGTFTIYGFDKLKGKEVESEPPVGSEPTIIRVSNEPPISS